MVRLKYEGAWRGERLILFASVDTTCVAMSIESSLPAVAFILERRIKRREFRRGQPLLPTKSTRRKEQLRTKHNRSRIDCELRAAAEMELA